MAGISREDWSDRKGGEMSKCIWCDEDMNDEWVRLDDTTKPSAMENALEVDEGYLHVFHCENKNCKRYGLLTVVKK